MNLIEGIGIRWYRSFYSEMQYVAPMGKVTLIVGANNVGKSNVLRFVDRVIGSAPKGEGGRRTIDHSQFNLDVPQGARETAEQEFAIPYGSTADIVATLQSKSNRRLTEQSIRALEQVFSDPIFRRSDTNLVWFNYSWSITDGRSPNTVHFTTARQQILNFVNSGAWSSVVNEIGDASASLTSMAGGQPWEDLQRIVNLLQPSERFPQTAFVDAFRQIRPSDGVEGSAPKHSGGGLVQRLSELQHPTVQNLTDRDRFDGISLFLQTVLEDPTAELNVPHTRTELYVRRGGLTLPLSSLGAGVEQVVILAAAATLEENTLVCMEEPEIHLHPVLQRKLLKYLATETSNQYLIATHSAHMLDSELAAIFHASMGDDGTEIAYAAAPKDRAAICADLGYRPSDLVQANAVIWVEGPSDRIYLRHWLQLADPSLVEGIDYSIMFYGGRLLSHLSANDPDVAEFISLRRLNRHIAIMIDSDKTSPEDTINKTKIRVAAEFDVGPGFAWVTDGRTIENYVPPNLFSAAVGAAHPNAQMTWAGEEFGDALGAAHYAGTPKQPDKVAIARKVAELWTRETPWPSELEASVRHAVTFVREATER